MKGRLGSTISGGGGGAGEGGRGQSIEIQKLEAKVKKDDADMRKFKELKDEFTVGQGKARAVLQKYGLNDLKDGEGNPKKLSADDFDSTLFSCFLTTFVH